MDTAVLATILGAHYVGDFLCQTRRMGNNKSSSVGILFQHIGVYTAVLAVSTWLLLGDEWIWVWAALNGAAHFWTDFVTSKMTKRFWTLGRQHAFWSTIGADQLIHAVTLLGTYNWMLSQYGY